VLRERRAARVREPETTPTIVARLLPWQREMLQLDGDSAGKSAKAD
jgi:hypothetical protein